MNIIFDNQIFIRQKVGGISRYFVELCNGLNGFDGVNAKIISPFNINLYLKESKVSNSRPIFLPGLSTRFGANRKISEFNRILSSRQSRRISSDVVHETYYSNEPIFHSQSKRVLTVYDMIRERMGTDLKKSQTKMRALSRADHVICISHSTRNDLVEIFGISSEKITVVHLGVSEFFSPLVNHDTPSRTPYFLFVGQRSGYKNFAFMLQAWVNVNNNFGELKIHVFGGGAFTSEEIHVMEKLKISHCIIKVDGSDEDLKREYQMASALIYPSVYEGFGMPILEAMASGCPVLCSNTSSMPEVGGRAVLFFDPQNVDSLTNCLLKFLDSKDLPLELRKMGLLQSENFSWQKTALQTLKVYEDLVS